MSLRIAPRSVDAAGRRGYAGAGDPYMSRLVKLVPAEAISIYPVIMSQAESITPELGGQRYAVYITAWVLLAMVFVLRWRATSAPGLGPQWGAILISAVAFFIWVHVMKGDFGFEMLLPDTNTATSVAGTRAVGGVPQDLKQFISNLALMAWTVLAPVVYRGDEQEA